ncbi:hypothetical protein GCM10010971_18680 [Silvimonas amylolytica]|uniref:Uncharacterized protein n=1 Tax=Silvimonas amylolytica TaxID=449663 RepID=A0ABQ2PLB4_9NEIS|nr:hypothetical protein GCM10010971_18680 [Silvimonas amylolytica]
MLTKRCKDVPDYLSDLHTVKPRKETGNIRIRARARPKVAASRTMNAQDLPNAVDSGRVLRSTPVK